jgi:hypothetical protein
MTIKEVLACDIPEGKYKLGMEQLKLRAKCIQGSSVEHQNIKDEVINSLCACFKTLYNIAIGKEMPEEEYDEMLKYLVTSARRQGRKVERTKVIDDVLGILNTLANKTLEDDEEHMLNVIRSHIETLKEN